MNTAQRKLTLGLSVFLGAMLVVATAVLGYAAHQSQTARFGDIFDRITSDRTQTWVIPVLISVAGISLVGISIFIGLFIFRSKDATHASPSLPKGNT